MKLFSSFSLADPDLQDAGPLFADGQDPDLQAEDVIAAAPAQTLHDKAKRTGQLFIF